MRTQDWSAIAEDYQRYANPPRPEESEGAWRVPRTAAELAERLRVCRARRHVNQRVAAREIGIHPSTLCRQEGKDAASVTSNLLAMLAWLQTHEVAS